MSVSIVRFSGTVQTCKTQKSPAVQRFCRHFACALIALCTSCILRIFRMGSARQQHNKQFHKTELDQSFLSGITLRILFFSPCRSCWQINETTSYISSWTNLRQIPFLDKWASKTPSFFTKQELVHLKKTAREFLIRHTSVLTTLPTKIDNIDLTVSLPRSTVEKKNNRLSQKNGQDGKCFRQEYVPPPSKGNRWVRMIEEQAGSSTRVTKNMQPSSCENAPVNLTLMAAYNHVSCSMTDSVQALHEAQRTLVKVHLDDTEFFPEQLYKNHPRCCGRN